MSNTVVLKDGKPIRSLGSPGNVHCTVPQMISNALDYSFDPYEAAVLPRMLPMRDDCTSRDRDANSRAGPKTGELHGGAIRELALGGRAVGY